MSAIKQGSANLKKNDVDITTAKPRVVNQNKAIAAILANRSKIAGSDSESDDSSDAESDFSF